MGKRKIGLLWLILFLLISGCQAASESDSQNTRSGPSDSATATDAAGQLKLYIPEYNILPYNGTVQEAHFNGDNITLLLTTGYIALGNVKKELCLGNLNSLQLEKIELSLPAGEIIQAVCTAGDASGGLATIYLVTGNADIRKDKGEEFRNHLLKLDKNGGILETMDISGIFGGENQPLEAGGIGSEPTIAGIEADSEGNLYCFTPMGKDILVLNPQGELQSAIEAGSVVTDLCTAHGKIYAVYFLDGNLTVGELHPSEQTLTPVYKDSTGTLGFSLTEGPDGQLLFTEFGKTLVYDFDTGETTPSLVWSDYNTDSANIANFKYLADGRILAVNTDGAGMDNAQPEYIFLREAAPGEEPVEKEILTVFCSPWTSVGWELEAAINRFNKTNPDYRFELLDYGLEFWGGMEVERLNRELITGEAADIMIFDVANPYTMRHPDMEKPAILPYQEYGEMGVFMNLYEYMDSDPEFHREDYFENIWEAFEADGELYYLPLAFDYDTVIANPADVGGRTGWTLDELMACVAEKGGRLDIRWQDTHGRSARQSILEFCLRAGKWELTKGGTFNRDLMHKMLTFAHQAGTETQSGEVPAGSLRLRVYERSLSGNVRDEYAAFYDEWGGYPVNIGYPAENGVGTFVRSSALAAINKGCPAPEAAWELLRAVLDGGGAFPLRKDMLREEWGREHLELIDISWRGAVQKGTAEYAARLEEMAESITTMSMTLPVEIIIREEAEYYFQGVKPVEEVVDVIANRVTIYLEERK